MHLCLHLGLQGMACHECEVLRRRLAGGLHCIYVYLYNHTAGCIHVPYTIYVYIYRERLMCVYIYNHRAGLINVRMEAFTYSCCSCSIYVCVGVCLYMCNPVPRCICTIVPVCLSYICPSLYTSTCRAHGGIRATPVTELTGLYARGPPCTFQRFRVRTLRARLGHRQSEKEKNGCLISLSLGSCIPRVIFCQVSL